MNFALILFLLSVATGILWAADKYVFRKRRAPDARDPLWVEYGASFFPIIIAVFLLRSFLVEPYKIPSGSMIPTLLVGDFILVNKYTYGIRLPVINKKVVELNSPRRGDVMVFRWPVDPSLDYIKRVVGVPGDKIAYLNKQLTINGVKVATRKVDDFLDKDRLYYTPRFVEQLDTVEHSVLLADEAPPFISQTTQFPYRDRCNYNSEGVVCEVPPGHYFMMGDNRDNSQDSRYWGFVPDENIVGKAFFVWFNFSDLKRIGSFH
ncbi:signal peptidase I [Denitratisoma oestradiolicum]|uniref:Signal peptidase I n=1 Tax=Denitratisoma oestradiolicum TaxID=311182 RepID=A0A6S6XTN6_9PROT|nr:signal peptidase I [Denitratisoma oestradiolicum]TWO80267.1 signal peptidase I [Denitratisoma oestradiolicum]CAB1369360.1 Signal peptidase I [Denitratisoma oestradiolicum]